MSDDVNVSIRRWRDSLACRESITTEKIDELQDHLENELRSVTTQGLTPEERVWVAAGRVGGPAELDRLFYEADPGLVWRRRILWMIVGYLVVQLWTVALNGLVTPLFSNLFALAGMERWLYAVSFMGIFGITIGGTMWLLYRLGTRGTAKSSATFTWARGLVVFGGFMTGYTVLSILCGAVSAQVNLLIAQGLYDRYTVEMDYWTWEYLVFAWMPYTGYWVPLMVFGLLGVLAWRAARQRAVV
ncbi:MAG: hypothetical protein AAGG38_05350 [Planctomycetota bacterium]